MYVRMHVGLLPDFYGQQQTAAMTTCIIIVAFAVVASAAAVVFVFVAIPFMVFIVFSSHVWAHTAAQPCTTRATPISSPPPIRRIPQVIA